MKKIVLVAAAAGLMSLAACNKSPEAAAVENNGDMMAANLDAAADNMQASVDNQADMMKDNAAAEADNMHAAADNVQDSADAKADNMH